MPTLSIKDVPATWAEALRQRAARNHRSLQGELMALVERSVMERPEADCAEMVPSGAGVWSRFAQPVTPPIAQATGGRKTVEQLAAELKAKNPVPGLVSGGCSQSSIAMIREDRDAR